LHRFRDARPRGLPVAGVERVIRRLRTLAFHVLRRHSRVSPQPSVCRSPCPPPRVGRSSRIRASTKCRTAACQTGSNPKDRNRHGRAHRAREVASEEVAPAGFDGPKSGREPEGSHQTVPRRCHRPKPESIAAGAATDLPEDRRPAPRSRDRRHLPRFGAFQRNQMCRSLMRWIASPAPSAPRVSHPLSGLIPAHPRGCVSSRIRS
jgi:hypothetical protein